jgi:hypothetical protein
LFKARFRVFETDKIDRFNNTKIVPMVAIMGVVVTHYAPIVTGMDVVIDVGEGVAGDAGVMVWAARVATTVAYPPLLMG